MTKTRQYFYGCGKRKSSVAQVRLYQKGEGKITINDRDIKDYFFGPCIGNVLAPLKITDTLKAFDITVLVKGGGHSSQADAVRHGIAKGLLQFDPQLRLPLKAEKFLTRDSRIKERKKPGLKRARRGPQWAKR